MSAPMDNNNTDTNNNNNGGNVEHGVSEDPATQGHSAF